MHGGIYAKLIVKNTTEFNTLQCPTLKRLRLVAMMCKITHQGEEDFPQSGGSGGIPQPAAAHLLSPLQRDH